MYKIRSKWRMGVTVIEEIHTAKTKLGMKIKVFFLRLFGDMIIEVKEAE